MLKHRELVKRLAAWLGICLVLINPMAARAQTTAALPSGARVRIELSDSLRPFPLARRTRVMVGRLARATPDTLFLQIGSPDTLRIARSTVRQLSISLGATRSRSAAEQALITSLTVAAVTYAAGERNGVTRNDRALTMGAVGFGFGALLGALRPYEHWRRVRD
jgi:hypothetical protein